MKASDQKQNPIIEGLMDRRTVVLEGEIDQENASEIGHRMLMLQMRSSDEINLVIDSGGGSVEAALRLCDIMSTVIVAPIRGIAVGRCGSAATFVMLHCSQRVSTPHSRFLIHSGTIGRISIQINDTTTKNLENLLKEVKRIEEIVVRLYTSKLTPAAWKSNKPSDAKRREFVRKLISRGDQQFDDWLSAEEAVEVGLIEKIVTEKFDVFA